MKWNIITDSSCDMFPEKEQTDDVQINSVPFIIRVGNTDFVDDENLCTADMLNAMEKSEAACHTACPSPGGFMEQFEKADCSIAVTISSKLSGSMNSAATASKLVQRKFPDKNIAVIDSHSTGPELVLCVEKIHELIDKGVDFEHIVSEAEAFLARTHVTFALSSFDNLIKSGRMSKLSGFVAKSLGMWGIGVGSEDGSIEMKGRARGKLKAISALIDSMRENGFHGGKVVISHCHNPRLAEKLCDRILESWENSTVQILPTRGLCSYYAERGGLIVSY